MKHRVTFILATLAGLASCTQAQEVMRVAFTWQEMVGNTTIPVSSPNSVVDPGEGARIAFSIEALINGANAVGQTTTYSPPPPPGNGTVRGIGSFCYNLRGDGGASSAAGQWFRITTSPLLSTGAFGPTVLLSGALIDSIGAGQFVAPGGTANGTNPIPDTFRGVWTPAYYSNRTVHFQTEHGTAVPIGSESGILVAYGITMPNPNDPTTWYDNHLTKYIATDYGAGVSIPIAPSPSTAALFAVSVCAMSRRRRTQVVEARL